MTKVHEKVELISIPNWWGQKCIGLATLLVLLECFMVVSACVGMIFATEMGITDIVGPLLFGAFAVFLAVCQLLAVITKSEIYSAVVGVIFGGMWLLFCGGLIITLPTAHDDGDWTTYDGIMLYGNLACWFYIGCTMLLAARSYANQKQASMAEQGQELENLK